VSAGPVSWEVFLCPRRGLSHQHVGSVRAADVRLAQATARDLFARRGRPQSLWVVRSQDVHAVLPDEKDPYFAAVDGKPFRRPGHFPALGAVGAGLSANGDGDPDGDADGDADGGSDDH
jgi:ring-1,2-phenylacetyl-CoA epoxidase subunit PaaB